MKWFSFDFLRSPERKELDRLKVKNAELQNELLANKLDESTKQQFKPYKKLIYTNGSITAVLHDGVVITKKKCDKILFDKVKDAYSEEVIRGLLLPEPELPKNEEYTAEEVKLVKDNLGVLRGHPDFEMDGENVYLKGVKLPLVPVVLASFIEIIERLEIEWGNEDSGELYDDLLEKYNSLKMFWLKLATSPKQESREQVLKFCKENDIRLSKTGNIIGYRRVVSWNTKNELNEFVEREYIKIKGWKKNPSNYYVYFKDGVYKTTLVTIPGGADYIGNLAELKADNCEDKEQYYTSQNNAGKYIFKIGDVYKADEEDALNENVLCSAGSGIHFASVGYDYSGFGDIPVVVLINPAKTIVIPTYDIQKGRTLEMKIACINPNKHGVHIDEKLIEQADNEYNEFTIQELEAAVANKDFSSLCIEEEVPVINLVDLKEISEQLRKRVVNI